MEGDSACGEEEGEEKEEEEEEEEEGRRNEGHIRNCKPTLVQSIMLDR